MGVSREICPCPAARLQAGIRRYDTIMYYMQCMSCKILYSHRLVSKRLVSKRPQVAEATGLDVVHDIPAVAALRPRPPGSTPLG